MDPRAFFPLGPPPFATKLNDEALEQRILKLAEFACRNGPSFIDVVRKNQTNNPEYAFLNGGIGASFFHWALHCYLTNTPLDQTPSSSLPLPPAIHTRPPPPPLLQQPPIPTKPPPPSIAPPSLHFPPHSHPHPHPHHLQPHPPPPPPPTEDPPFDPFSFPPGLISKLVQESMKTDDIYTPLNPNDIEQCPVPPPPDIDAYLKAQLDKFYAQIADYRPGIAFSDIEGESVYINSTSIGAGAATRHYAVDPSRKTSASLYHHASSLDGIDDGSGGFRGSGMAGGKGLGYDSMGGGSDDVFQSYRRMRSGSYHSELKGGRRSRHRSS